MDVFSLEESVGKAGDRYRLQCNVRRTLIAPNNTLLEVMWLDHDGYVINSGINYSVSGMSNTTTPNLSSTLAFSRLTTSQAGLYSCVANVTIPGIVMDQQLISTFTVRVASELFLAKSVFSL